MGMMILPIQERFVLRIAAAAESVQSCPTLCDPTDGSLLGSPIPGILQARTLEWVAISFSNAWKWKAKVKSLSCARLLATPWTVAYQAPPSMGFSRQEYWSGVPLPHVGCPFSMDLSSNIIVHCALITIKFLTQYPLYVKFTYKWRTTAVTPWSVDLMVSKSSQGFY